MDYLGYRYHVLAVSASANRAKGDSGPDQSRPENQAFWCEHAQAWASVKFESWRRRTAQAEEPRHPGALLDPFRS